MSHPEMTLCAGQGSDIPLFTQEMTESKSLDFVTSCGLKSGIWPLYAVESTSQGRRLNKSIEDSWYLDWSLLFLSGILNQPLLAYQTPANGAAIERGVVIISTGASFPWTERSKKDNDCQ